MTTLPEQAHKTGTAVAARAEGGAYQLTASMVTLPTLYIAQFQSEAFKRSRVKYGSLFIAIGADDPDPIVVGEAGEPLSDPVLFYIHSVQDGHDYAEDPKNPKKKTLGRLGTTFADALKLAGGDPRRVWQKFGYQLTVPAYENLPVRFFAGGNSARSARWLNTQISIDLQQGRNPLETPYQIQARPTSNAEGSFAVAEFSRAEVKAKDLAKHQELASRHAEILPNVQPMDVEDLGAAQSEAVVNAPSLG